MRQGLIQKAAEQNIVACSLTIVVWVTGVLSQICTVGSKYYLHTQALNLSFAIACAEC